MRKPDSLKCEGVPIAFIRPNDQGIVITHIIYDTKECQRVFSWVGRVLNWMKHKDVQAMKKKNKK